MVVGHNAQKGGSAEAPEDALRPGDRLLHGQYRIDRYLNAGGFGITYLAMDSLDRKVVIKECFPNELCCRSEGLVRARLRAHQEDFQTVVRNFGQEALRMAKLKHPNIVGVHQVFEDNCTAYMALDFVQGRDLLEIIEQEREMLTPAEIKRILLQLLDAVDYMHARDVLHRDISPDNILLDTSGNPILIDFGAAREVATRASRALSALHVVKDGYSPQEFYISNGLQTASSDLYSLAATFYHLITGSAPPNSQVRLAALASEEADPYVPISPRTPGYDHFFLGAIDSSLAVFPKHRMKTAVNWIEEIDRERRQMAMVQKAKMDEAIELSIRQLTIETNASMMDEENRKNEQKAGRGVSPSLSNEARRAKPEHEQNTVTEKSAKPRSEITAETVPPAPKTIPKRDLRLHAAKIYPETSANPDTEAFKAMLKPRRRSLLSRIVSVPIWLFASGRQNEQNKDGGLEK